MGAIRYLLVILVILVTACAEEEPERLPVEVIVDTAKLRPFFPTVSFIGRLEAEDDVNIQAKVSGYLLERNFREGDIVKTGDALFRIDPAQYEAALAQAKASLAKARANLEVAERNYSRGEELVGKGAISQSEMDDLRAGKLQAEAEILSTEAAVKSTQVDLNDTLIKAPIDGRIGRSEHSVGDLIGPDIGTLTTLVSLDPMKASFQVSEAQFLAAEQEGTEEERQSFVVKVELSNREVYPHQGYIDYVSNRIDAATGTIEVRASIPNPEGLLRPGQYVKVIIEVPRRFDMLMIPQAAVQADQQGSYVLTVAPDNTIARKNVMLDERVGELVIVQGLEENEQVVVRGLQQVRAGQPVRVREMPQAGDQQSPAEG